MTTVRGVPPHIKKAIAAGEGWQGTLTGRRKDGSVYQQDATISPVLESMATRAATSSAGVSSPVRIIPAMSPRSMHAAARSACCMIHDYVERRQFC